MEGPSGAEPVLLGQARSDADALRLACRLTAEGIGSHAQGPWVWVRGEDEEAALALARLFADLDAGRSVRSPSTPTRGATSARRVAAAIGMIGVAVAVLVVCVLAALAL